MKKERILLLVESPNKVKTIKSFLPNNYIVMASVGHISEIKNGGSYWNTGIEPNDNFKTNYAISSDKKDIVKNLKNQVELATKVIIASDPDREGEAIAWSLKKFLKIPDAKYERVTFHEITKNAVLKALENPRKIDNDLVDAAQARQKLDKMLGYRLSPIARKQIRAKSVGRCQSAGLKLIVDREKEIQNFNSIKYYDLFLYFKEKGHDFKAKYIGTPKHKIDKIKSLKEAEKIMNECDAPFSIIDVEKKVRTENPKPPFTTSTFQQEVSTKLGISVKKSMEYAQKLFEGIDVNGKHIALITYIRTDSPEFAPEFLPILEKYVKINFGAEYYSPIKKIKKAENTQDGHEAIRPVDLTVTPEKLSTKISDKNLLKVYDIIYKRTIATMMKPSKVNEVIYTIGTTSNHLFEFSLKKQTFDGFKKIYNFDKIENDNISQVTFKKGSIVHATSLEPIEKQTNPPKRFKEASFIKELESTGIGRPSTFATIVSTILDDSRGYCTITDKYLVPTEKGMKLIDFLDNSFPELINITYTSQMEKSLDLIAKGKLKENQFLASFYTKLEKSVSKVGPIANTPKITDKICPECGKPLVIRYGKYGEFLGCSGFPKCKHVEKLTK